MIVKVAPVGETDYVVIVPVDYCDSAMNIDKISKTVQSESGAGWHILREDDLLDVEI